MTIPNDRQTVRDAEVQPLGKFAVFRHTTKLRRAHFCALHDTYDGACKEAIRLLTSSVAADGSLQHLYYVVEVAARFEAGPEGLKSAER